MEIWSILLLAAVAAAALVFFAVVRRIAKRAKTIGLGVSATVFGVALTVAGMAVLRPHNDLAMWNCVSFTAEDAYANLSDEGAQIRAEQDCQEQEAKDPQLFTAVWVS